MEDQERFDLWIDLMIKEFEAEVKYYTATLLGAQMRLNQMYNLKQNLERARNGEPPVPLEMPEIKEEPGD